MMSCQGNCSQGRKPCACPEACELPIEEQFAKENFSLLVFSVAAAAIAVAVIIFSAALISLTP